MNYCLEGDFIQYGNIYGRISINSTLFDDSKELGGTEDLLIQHLIRKIKIYTKNVKEQQFISGLQLTYQNIKTKEIKELPIRYKSEKNNKNEEIEIFELKPGEYLNNFYVRFSLDNKYIYQLGFETNKKRKLLKGTEYGEEKNIRTNGGKNIIIGTYGYYSEFLDSLGLFYVDLEKYLKRYYIGYFELKLKLKKDEKFKANIKKSITDYSEKDKCLFKTSLLPDAVFNEIMKFCIF